MSLPEERNRVSRTPMDSGRISMSLESPSAAAVTPSLVGSGAAVSDSGLSSLYTQAYEWLRTAAHRVVATQPGTPTLSGTALISESFLKLAHIDPADITSERHFRHLVCRAMEQALASYIRAKKAAKRGGEFKRVFELDILTTCFAQAGHDFDDLLEALDHLEQESKRSAESLRLRFFQRLTYLEIGKLMGCSPKTIERDVALGKAKLRVLLSR